MTDPWTQINTALKKGIPEKRLAALHGEQRIRIVSVSRPVPHASRVNSDRASRIADIGDDRQVGG